MGTKVVIHLKFVSQGGFLVLDDRFRVLLFLFLFLLLFVFFLLFFVGLVCLHNRLVLPKLLNEFYFEFVDHAECASAEFLEGVS